MRNPPTYEAAFCPMKRRVLRTKSTFGHVRPSVVRLPDFRKSYRTTLGELVGYRAVEDVLGHGSPLVLSKLAKTPLQPSMTTAKIAIGNAPLTTVLEVRGHSSI